jgi:predicted anti-sigma-YlaC factor YlaD
VNCDNYSEQVSLLVDADLASNLHADLFAHLGHCAECRTLLDTALRLRRAAQQENAQFPDHLDQHLKAKLGLATPIPERLHSRALSWSLAAAATILLCAGAFWIGRSGAPKVEPEDGSTTTTSAALVSNTTRIEVLYAIPAVEVVGYSTARAVTDTTLNK